MFKKQVLNFIKTIPKGKVASYGQVAAACGSARGARAVGAVLRGLGEREINLPWWRVVNNQGIISLKGNWTASKELQKKLLEREGIKVSANYSLDIRKYRYQNYEK